MSVSVILCEGIAGGRDVRLLDVILRGMPRELVPSGGKDGFPSTVIALRPSFPATCAFADNDFPRYPEAWTGAKDAAEWHVPREERQVMVGWRWRRKEIENYFIDPDLLSRVFRWSDTQKAEYTAKLDTIFDKLAHVTAARIALTACAAPRNRLETQVPLFITDAAAMKAQLSEKAKSFNAKARVDEQELLDTFDRILPACQPGGKFRSAALDVFAGKDILAKMQQTSGMPPVVKNDKKLVENVIDALRKDTTSHTWLSEWENIRKAIQDWKPA